MAEGKEVDGDSVFRNHGALIRITLVRGRLHGNKTGWVTKHRRRCWKRLHRSVQAEYRHPSPQALCQSIIDGRCQVSQLAAHTCINQFLICISVCSPSERRILVAGSQFVSKFCLSPVRQSYLCSTANPGSSVQACGNNHVVA